MDVRSTLDLCACLSLIGMSVSDLELVSLCSHLSEVGILAPRLNPPSFVYRGLCRLVREPALVISIVAIRILCSVTYCVLPRSHESRVVLLGLVVACGALLRLRGGLGNNASDQMFGIVQIGSFLGFLSHCELFALLFIAGQMMLSYMTAAIVKAISPVWRSGEGLISILNTNTFGHAGVRTILSSRARWQKGLSWTVILLELFASLAPLAPFRICLSALALVLLLHLGIACVMGLNSFVPSYCATFPAAIYTSRMIHTH